jgi:hypothetical protein
MTLQRAAWRSQGWHPAHWDGTEVFDNGVIECDAALISVGFGIESDLGDRQVFRLKSFLLAKQMQETF